MSIVLKQSPALPWKRHLKQIDQRLAYQKEHKGLECRFKGLLAVSHYNDSKKHPSLSCLAHSHKRCVLKDRDNKENGSNDRSFHGEYDDL